jgi:hypothetical protein
MFRIPPAMEPGAYQTYRILAPTTTHWVQISCEEADCPAFKNGWASVFDERTVTGAQTAQAIRKMYKQGSFKEIKLEDGFTRFEFSAGQPCFQASMHKKQVKPDILLVQGGDYRGNPYNVPTRTHTKPEFWAEDFAEHQMRLAKLIERG